MGAAFDAMCKNEELQNTLNKKNRQIREQKKLLIELAEGVLKYFDGGTQYKPQDVDGLLKTSEEILKKLNKN